VIAGNVSAENRERIICMHSNGEIVEVYNATRETTVASNVRIAKSFLSRGRGLMFTSSLDPEGGLLIDPCGSIHMFFMRYPIDVLYVDRADRVVRVQRALKPWRIGPLHTSGAKYVIELPVGSLDRSQSDVGDMLRIDSRTG
jgi:uncharacterized membrane protein (UPF0127 family)